MRSAVTHPLNRMAAFLILFILPYDYFIKKSIIALVSLHQACHPRAGRDDLIE
jgi:hypothetical protein